MTPSNRRVKAAQLPLDLAPQRELAPARAPVAARPPSPVLAALRTTLGIVLVVSAAVGVAWAARRHVMTSARFAVTEIDVLGHDRRSADSIAAESGVTAGANVFSLDLDAARARILADPWIAQATLARKLPGTILIEVTERKPVALVAMGDIYLATAEGEPFKKLAPEDSVDLPLVTGLRADALAEDRDGTMRCSSAAASRSRRGIRARCAGSPRAARGGARGFRRHVLRGGGPRRDAASVARRAGSFPSQARSGGTCRGGARQARSQGGFDHAGQRRAARAGGGADAVGTGQGDLLEVR